MFYLVVRLMRVNKCTPVHLCPSLIVLYVYCAKLELAINVT